LDATVSETLADLVRQEWAALMADHDLELVSSDKWSVTLRSRALQVEVARDWGQLSVAAFPLSGGTAADGWQYEGMVGKASEARLLQIAADRLGEDPRVLLGDARLFAEIALERQRLSREWTTFYEGKASQPRPGRLP
jgi:hypothetical protein